MAGDCEFSRCRHGFAALPLCRAQFAVGLPSRKAEHRQKRQDHQDDQLGAQRPSGQHRPRRVQIETVSSAWAIAARRRSGSNGLEMTKAGSTCLPVSNRSGKPVTKITGHGHRPHDLIDRGDAAVARRGAGCPPARGGANACLASSTAAFSVAAIPTTSWPALRTMSATSSAMIASSSITRTRTDATRCSSRRASSRLRSAVFDVDAEDFRGITHGETFEHRQQQHLALQGRHVGQRIP